MNHNPTKALLSTLEALLTVTTKQADRHGLDEIRISTTRAKELLRDITTARKGFTKPQPTTSYFNKLDSYFNL